MAVRVMVRYQLDSSVGYVPAEYIKNFNESDYDSGKNYEVFYSSTGQTLEEYQKLQKVVHNIDDLRDAARTPKEKAKFGKKCGLPGFYYARICAMRNTAEEFQKFLKSREHRQLKATVSPESDTANQQQPEKNKNLDVLKKSGANHSAKRVFDAVKSSVTKKQRTETLFSSLSDDFREPSNLGGSDEDEFEDPSLISEVELETRLMAKTAELKREHKAKMVIKEAEIAELQKKNEVLKAQYRELQGQHTNLQDRYFRQSEQLLSLVQTTQQLSNRVLNIVPSEVSSSSSSRSSNRISFSVTPSSSDIIEEEIPLNDETVFSNDRETSIKVDGADLCSNLTDPVISVELSTPMDSRSTVMPLTHGISAMPCTERIPVSIRTSLNKEFSADTDLHVTPIGSIVSLLPDRPSNYNCLSPEIIQQKFDKVNDSSKKGDSSFFFFF